MNELFTLGDSLRMARERLKMSQSDVAEATHIKVHIVDAIEHNDFSRIAVPLYGKGFVKLYAECVGLDPEPLVKDYLDRHARSVRPSLKSDFPTRGAAPHEPLPAMPLAKLARKRPGVDWRALADDAALALHERVAWCRAAWARLWSSWGLAAGPAHARRYRRASFRLVPTGLGRPLAIAAGVLVAAGLLIYGGVRLVHRAPHGASAAAPAKSGPPPAAAVVAVKTPAPLRLAEEPPPPYLKLRLP